MGLIYIMNKKIEKYIKFSHSLRIFHLNIVKECIVIYRATSSGTKVRTIVTKMKVATY